jgi:hypothetical protein
MTQAERFREAIDRYKSFDWHLRRVLLTAPTQSKLAEMDLLPAVDIKESEIDAAWFSRPSHEGREAWELRLIGDAPYALFETFEPDEGEEEREEVRLEMEARLRDYAKRG